MPFTLTTLQQSVGDQLIAPDVYEHVLSLANDIIFRGEYKNAYLLSQSLVEKIVKTTDPTIRRQLQELYATPIVRLQALRFDMLTDNEIDAICAHGLAAILKDPDLDIQGAFQTALLGRAQSQRDVLKTRWLDAILNSTEQLTTVDILNKEVSRPGTVIEWVKFYVSSLPDGRSSSVYRAQFFSRVADIPRMTEIDKQAVSRLINLVEYLKKSTYTPEGFEEDIIFVDEQQRVRLLSNGVVEDITRDASSLRDNPGFRLPAVEVPGRPTEPVRLRSTVRSAANSSIPQLSPSAPAAAVPTEQKIITALAGSPAREQKILAARQQLAGKSLNTQQLRAEFFASVQQQNIERTIACMQLMIERNELGLLLRQDEKLRPFLTNLWAQRISKGAAQEFAAAPDAPKQVRRFLRYVLQERLGMNEGEAAAQGVRLGQWFVRAGQNQYNKIAYYDLPSANFRWFGDNE